MQHSGLCLAFISKGVKMEYRDASAVTRAQVVSLVHRLMFKNHMPFKSAVAAAAFLLHVHPSVIRREF